MKRENFIYPSFFIKETKEGIYSSTYPVRISEYNFSIDDALYKWKFWHPNTQILFTSNDYLSKQSLTGETYREYLIKNITRLNISENPQAPLSYPYKFIVLPITFTNNSKDSNPSYSYRCDDLLLDSVRYYDGKIIWFSTNWILRPKVYHLFHSIVYQRFTPKFTTLREVRKAYFTPKFTT